MPDKRQLQAVMFTDIHGYSARMGEDEQNTVRVVREHREIVRAALAQHSGREVRTIGDAFLVLFDAAVDAVQCAIAIQTALARRNQELPAKDQVHVRIGINVGDVLIGEEGELYGEAVNIAARVEPLAPPGGICVTTSVHAQVHRAVSEPFESLGEVPLKNIERPPALYVLRLGAEPSPRRPTRSRRALVAGAAVALTALGVGAAWLMSSWTPRATRAVAVSSIPEAEAAYEKAVEAYSLGEQARAARLAEAASQADPASPRIWLLRRFASTDQTAGALALERATALSRDQQDGTAALIRLVDATDREAGAGIAHDHASPLGPRWDEWQARNPDDVLGAFIRAQMYPRHGDDTAFHATDAKRVHLDVIELREFMASHPRWVVAHEHLARQLSAAGLDEAKATLEAGLAACPECTALRFDLAGLLYAYEHFDDARREATTVLAQDPAMALDARSLLANIALWTYDEPERLRLQALVLAPDTPGVQRSQFGTAHAAGLIAQGRAADAQALYAATIDLDIGERRVDDAATTLMTQAGYLVFLDEVARVEPLLPRYAELMAMPELGSLQRNRLGLDDLVQRGWLAWERRDSRAARELAKRMRELPPERTAGCDTVTAVRNLDAIADAIDGKELDVTLLAKGCWGHLLRARLFATMNDERAFEEWEAVVAAPECLPDSPGQVRANVGLGERHLQRGDRDAVARCVKAARHMWGTPDPDLHLTKRLVALEKALEG